MAKRTSGCQPSNIYELNRASGYNAYEDLVGGDVIGLRSDGTWAKAVTGGTPKPRCMAAKSAKAGEPVTAVERGHMAGWTALTPGATYFASATAGAIADTGTVIMGWALDAYTLVFAPIPL